MNNDYHLSGAFCSVVSSCSHFAQTLFFFDITFNEFFFLHSDIYKKFCHIIYFLNSIVRSFFSRMMLLFSDRIEVISSSLFWLSHSFFFFTHILLREERRRTIHRQAILKTHFFFKELDRYFLVYSIILFLAYSSLSNLARPHILLCEIQFGVKSIEFHLSTLCFTFSDTLRFQIIMWQNWPSFSFFRPLFAPGLQLQQQKDR